MIGVHHTDTKNTETCRSCVHLIDCINGSNRILNMQPEAMSEDVFNAILEIPACDDYVKNSTPVRV
jgi:hypothetical protein